MLANKKKRKIRRYQIKKDYQSKSFKNPFFRTDKTDNKKRSLSLKVYIIGILIIIFFILYGLFLSPLFMINNIKINGLGRLPESAISQRLWDQTNNKSIWPLRQKNILLFDKKKAETDLITNFNFSKVKISKKLFHTISVDIEERPYAFIWSESGQNYYSDSKGYIIKDSVVKADDLKKFPIIQNDTPDTLIENDYLKVDQSYLTFIFAVKTALEKDPDMSSMPIDRFMISQELNMIKVRFGNGLLAYFNTKDDISKQIDKLVVVKNQKIKDNLSKINYIDLRYGDKVYIGNK